MVGRVGNDLGTVCEAVENIGCISTDVTDLVRPQAPNPGLFDSVRTRLSLWRQERSLRKELDADSDGIFSATTARSGLRIPKFQIISATVGASLIVFAGLWAYQLWTKQPPTPIDELIPILDESALSANTTDGQNSAVVETLAQPQGTGGSSEDVSATVAEAAVTQIADTGPLSSDISTGQSATPGDHIVGNGGGCSAPNGAAETALIQVHVLGAVSVGGVVELPKESRVQDAIEAAGGVSADADIERINLAAHITDGDWVWVPHKGVSEPPEIVSVRSDNTALSSAAATGATSASSTGSPLTKVIVDINSASASELETLSGVGPATASAIIETRSRRGPFLNVDELVEVPGIGPGRLERLRPHIVATVKR